MKKTLVAIAALAAFGAQAQSSVTMSGIMDAGYQSITNLGDQKTNQVGQSGARTTTVKLNGTEDLGAGMTANFQFEVQPSIIAGDGNKYNAVYPAGTQAIATNSTAQGSGAASPQSGLVGKGASFVGLKDANLGEVQFGTINTGTFGAFAGASPLGTGIGSGYGSGNTFGDFTRVESSMAYFTPTYSGFNARIQKGVSNDSQFGTASTATANAVVLRRNAVLDIAASYTNGPLAARFGRLESTTTGNEATAGIKTTTQILGGSYDAGVAKFSIATGTIKNNAATTPASYKLNTMGVTVPFGANRVIAQTGYVKYSEGAATLNIGEKVKTTGIAFERDLSKRTFAYLRLESTDLAGNSSKSYVMNGAAGTTVAWGANSSVRKVTSVGISHAF